LRIDCDCAVGVGYVWNKFPDGAEDFTGDIHLRKRIEFLRHLDFFIGWGNGLSWLGWGTGIPVALISGFRCPSASSIGRIAATTPTSDGMPWTATSSTRIISGVCAITGKQVIETINRLRDFGLAEPKEIA
jgi:uncharacterized membrane protein YfcA